MDTIRELLNNTSHRPYVIPEGNWFYYQEWNRVLFLHWIVPIESVRELIPKNLHIDTFEGNCCISLVAFTMERIRLKFLPSIGFLSDFDEINVRTYIDNGNKKGVYFLNIEAGKALSSIIAKSISGLPYEKARIYRTDKTYSSENKQNGFTLNTTFETGKIINKKSELDTWLTERYCLYLDSNNQLYSYDIHHKEWQLKTVKIGSLDISYKKGGINLTNTLPNSSHYSDGVKVLAWNREQMK